MRFLSLFSGIEAASVAWNPLGWKAVAFSEIEPFPCAVLAHHYPDVPNLGDVSKITKDQIEALGPINLVCGGFPCQDLSVAGKRKGFSNADGTSTRSGLFFDAMRVATWANARWLVIENVPGMLSNNRGRDFAAVVGEMAGCEFDVPPDGWRNAGFAVGPLGLVEWVTLDAQFVRVESHPRAVPQRRRRVFVVRDSGNWTCRPPLFLVPESLSGHPAPSRKARQGVAPTLSARTKGGGGLGTDFDCDGGLVQAFGGNNTSGAIDVATARSASASASGRMDFESETFLVAHALRADGFGASEEDGTGRGTPLIPIDMRQASRGATMTNNRPEGSSGGAPGTGIGEDGDPAPTISTSHIPAIAFDCKASGQSGFGVGEIASTQRAMGHADSHTNGGGHQAVMTGMQVRRLTPLETERLQGQPDGYTAITVRGKPAADGPRYKSHGNSWAINCVSWIGERINQVDAIPTSNENPQ
jgi:DNA (cytosine-5)-methyltransferase 1